MSDSDDDTPLGQRAAPTTSKSAAKIEPEDDDPFKQPAPRARKPPVVDSSDSDDVPIGQNKPAAASAKPAAGAKPKPKPAAKPQSAAECALTKNESLVKREVEHQQLVEEVAHAKKAAKQQATAKRKANAKADGAKGKGKEAADGKLKKERKEYDMPGQTKNTPDETDSLRKFYASLRVQRPESEMARKWLAQVGLLPRDEAEAFVREVATSRAAGRTGKSPTKPSKPRAPRPAAAAGDLPKQRGRPTGSKTAPHKRKAKPLTQAPAKKRKVGRKDRAFSDGGLITAADSDSDDDVPLAARAATRA